MKMVGRVEVPQEAFIAALTGGHREEREEVDAWEALLPIADPAPRRRPAAGLGGRRCAGPATSGSTCTCRSAACAAATATSTPTRADELRGAQAQRLRRRRPSPRSARPRAVLGATPACPARPVSTVFFGGGTPTLLPVGRPGRDARTRVARHLGPRARRRGDHRGEPRLGRRRLRWPRWRRPASPGCRSACSRPCRTCSRPSSARTTRERDPAGGALGAGRRARGQPRPHLRHAGGVPRRLAALSSTPRSPSSPTTSRAYALIVEDGTKLARQIRRGEVAAARRRPRRPTCTSWPTACWRPPATTGTR